MNQPFLPAPKPSNKLLLIIVLSIFATVLTCFVLTSHQFKRLMMTQQERIDDTAASTTDTATTNQILNKQDSVQLAHGKVPASTFQSDYSAERWYAKYNSNKVAFNDQFDKKQIDIYGTIKTINDSWMGYSLIRLEPGEGVYADIVCNDVVGEQDVWRNEVKKVSVGQSVHIRGTFWKSDLQSNDFHLEHCHIIADL